MLRWPLDTGCAVLVGEQRHKDLGGRARVAPHEGGVVGHERFVPDGEGAGGQLRSPVRSHFPGKCFPSPFLGGAEVGEGTVPLYLGRWVARCTMYLDMWEGGRGVLCAPLKLNPLFMTFLAQLVQGTAGYYTNLFTRFWFGFCC